MDEARERFEEFHQTNPSVYNTLKRLALQAKGKGQKIGIRMIWEVMRWEHLIIANDPNQSLYKLNNNYTSFYARLLMQEVPELNGFFEIRGKSNKNDHEDISKRGGKEVVGD